MPKKICNLPSEEELVSSTTGTPLSWEFSLLRHIHQSDDSFVEQEKSIKIGMEQITKYNDPAPGCVTKGLIIVGGPGVGKTTMLQIFGLIALSRGLSVQMSALMAERSTQLGGSHLAKVFGIPVNKKASPTRLAALAVMNLLRSPSRFEALRRIDILLVDELGTVSAELMSILDMIARRIRGSSQFMGGILVMSTMDWLQLHPVGGRPPLLSPFLISSFLYRKLEHSVRASQDQNLQNIQEIARLLPSELTSDILGTFRTLVEKHCTFVPNWEHKSLTPEKLRLFGKKVATRNAETLLLNAMKKKHGTLLSKRSVDSESTLESNWQEAHVVTTRELSGKAKEPRDLFFYPRAHYEITFNQDGKFAQGQLAVLKQMPTQHNIDSWDPIEVFVAPEGTKTVATSLTSDHHFLSAGWTEEKVKTAPERAYILKYGLAAKRKQYGLRHRIASTIHSGMGQDLEYVITRVTSERINPDYILWEREQVVVLMSRTHFAANIIFVGKSKETIDALVEVLRKPSQYSEYMEYLLDKLCATAGGTRKLVINQHAHPLRRIDIDIPQDTSGFVYLLVSLKDRKSTYVGETKNMILRLKQHNSGFGAKSTSNPSLRPWALMGYIVGFEGKSPGLNRKYYEKCWQQRLGKLTRDKRRLLTPDDVADQAVLLIKETHMQDVLKYIEHSTFKSDD